jgi:glycosyltransferase involved in cell wall biosynthesis
MKITYFQRRVIPNFHFSVEIIFNDVRKHLPVEVEYDVLISKYYSKGFFPRLYNALEAFIKSGEVNHVTGDISYIGIFLPARKTIHTMLDSGLLLDSRGIKRWLLQMFWMKIPAKRCVFITTISEAAKKEIVEFTGCKAEKVKVIPIALSPVFKRVDRTYQWAKPRILMIGTAPNKNTFRMIDALKGLNVEVKMVGKPEPSIKDHLEKSGLVYSYQSGLDISQMNQMYQESDVLLFASTYEGFGMPIMEAQSVGTPVVTSNISSMPEVAGQNGAVLVDPYSIESIRNGVMTVMNDEQKRAKLIETGFENVKRFDPYRISNLYLELYKQI